jgi:hypothetical protein
MRINLYKKHKIIFGLVIYFCIKVNYFILLRKQIDDLIILCLLVTTLHHSTLLFLFTFSNFPLLDLKTSTAFEEFVQFFVNSRPVSQFEGNIEFFPPRPQHNTFCPSLICPTPIGNSIGSHQKKNQIFTCQGNVPS